MGHKAHSLRTINGVPLISLLSPANISDQDFILVLIEALVDCYPNLEFAYIILDRGYDIEEIHHDIYEFFGIIAVVIRKKLVYPKGFNKDGYPLCPWGFAMKPKVIDYQRKRTRNACFKLCNKSKQRLHSHAIISKSNQSLVVVNMFTLKTGIENLALRYPTA